LRRNLRFLCVRNFFIGSEARTRWTKGIWYAGRDATGIESAHGIAFYIESNETMGGTERAEYMVKKKDFDKYFKTEGRVREERINRILDVRDSDDDLVSGDS